MLSRAKILRFEALRFETHDFREGRRQACNGKDSYFGVARTAHRGLGWEPNRADLRLLPGVGWLPKNMLAQHSHDRILAVLDAAQDDLEDVLGLGIHFYGEEQSLPKLGVKQSAALCLASDEWTGQVFDHTVGRQAVHHGRRRRSPASRQCGGRGSGHRTGDLGLFERGKSNRFLKKSQVSLSDSA